MDPLGNSLITQLFIILFLTLINAVCAATEIAFVSLNQQKMKQMAETGNRKAKRVLRLLDNSDDFLATIQVVITLAGFFSSASAATTFADLIMRYIPGIWGGKQIAILIVTLILSYFTLVLGELYPKQVALQMPEKVALLTAGFISIVQRITKPFVILLSASTGLLKRLTPIDFTKEEEKFTRSEMKALLDNSRNDGAIDLEEFSMLQGVLSLDSKLAREVMVPRTDTQMIDIEDDIIENLEELLTSPYSRIPLYEEDKDNVIGVIHVKNVLKASRQVGFENINLLEIANEPLFVPSTIYIDDLLLEFRREQQHMAILKDEYGGVEGIVTLEDLIEEIVGEIEDESDTASKTIRKVDEHNYYIDGILPLDKYNQIFHEKLHSEDVDTIAGMIIHQIGYVPDDDERVSVRMNDHVLTTTQIENGRIRGIHVVYDPDRNLQVEYDINDLDYNGHDDDHYESEENYDYNI
ncbi:hemolysin family protein [Vaginisenegalia massiliensis]|uniref:hemolysin family protein n=1 Tax=Vaginisenegalia massiliensis TaxID=2058294 RepID=UPI000F5260E4|nr:hemolysin family protein [Vaginisenegalia massiliensis]